MLTPRGALAKRSMSIHRLQALVASNFRVCPRLRARAQVRAGSCPQSVPGYRPHTIVWGSPYCTMGRAETPAIPRVQRRKLMDKHNPPCASMRRRALRAAARRATRSWAFSSPRRANLSSPRSTRSRCCDEFPPRRRRRPPASARPIQHQSHLRHRHPSPPAPPPPHLTTCRCARLSRRSGRRWRCASCCRNERSDGIIIIGGGGGGGGGPGGIATVLAVVAAAVRQGARLLTARHPR